MMYDLTLRDLSLADTQFGVCLRLYGCREVRVAGAMPDPNSFLTYMVMAKAVGYQMIAQGHIASINAVEPPDDYIAAALADSDSSELRRDDPMYRVANEYDSHQLMREEIRETLMKHGRRLARSRRRTRDEELEELHRAMGVLTLWLALHDPEFANVTRQRMFDCLKEYRRAILTVACTKKLAYVRVMSSGIADLSDALIQADNSDRSRIFYQH